MVTASGRRQLHSKSTVITNTPAGVYAVQSAALQMDVYVIAASTSEGIKNSSATWKGLSVQFTGGKIASVEMKLRHIHALKSDKFFMAADLGGTGLSWPLGHVATVTFAAGTDVHAVRVDYDSMNTYLVQNADPACVPMATTACASVTVRGTMANRAAKAKPTVSKTSVVLTTEVTQMQDVEHTLDMMMTVAIICGLLLVVGLLTTAAIFVRGRGSEPAITHTSSGSAPTSVTICMGPNGDDAKSRV